MPPRLRSFTTRSLARALLVAAIPLLSKSAPALAQFGAGDKEPFFRVGVGGGVTVPISDASSALQNGVNGSGFVQLNVFGSDLPALRFSFSYSRFDYKPQAALTTTGTNTVNPGSSQILGGTGGVRIHLTPGQVRPYVALGVGAFNVRDLVNTSTGSQNTISNTNFGVDAGGGIEMRMGRLSAFVEGKIQNVFVQSSGLLKASSIQTIPITFGILF
jgi:hypothetical protein